MDNTKYIIAGLIILAVLSSGCLDSKEKPSEPAATGSQTDTGKSDDTVGSTGTEKAVETDNGAGGAVETNTEEPRGNDKTEEKNVATINDEDIQILLNAIAGSGSYKCTFKNLQNGVEVITDIWVKGKNILANVNKGGTKNALIIKNNVFYFWDIATKKGIKIDIRELGDDSLEDYNPITEEAIKKNPPIEATCEEAVIGDALFDVPLDLELTDLTGVLSQTEGS